MDKYLKTLSKYINYDETLMRMHRLQGLYGKDIDCLKKKYNKINSMGQYALTSLTEAGVEFIVLKGFAVMNILYKNYWNRIYNDIDILINEKEIPKVEKALKEIGYIQGKFDETQKIVVQSARKEIVYQRMYTHQIHEFLKYDEVLSEIDVNFKFEWNGYGNTKNILSNKLAFENTMTFHYKEKEYKSLNYDLLFIHLCCHIYNEAVNFVFSYFDKNKDPEEIKLFRLIDIMKLVELNRNNWGNILEVINQHGIMNEITFTLSVLNRLFPNFIDDNIPVKFVMDDDVVDYYYDEKGTMKKWPISLFDRLFNLELKIKVLKTMFI